MSRISCLVLLLLLALAGTAPAQQAPPPDADSPAGVLDRPARAWSFDRWLRTAPLRAEDLRGRVVLLRWFTEECRFCEGTLPELEALRRRYADRGLVVVGVYHPKPRRAVRDTHILQVAERLGFHGPLAVDERWSTLERWWLDGQPERNWTSVSFLMDGTGVVRWVHTGGEYHPSRDPRHHRCQREYTELVETLERLLPPTP
jgi:hypothetical protein